jgi:hypothetical protein
MEIALRGKEAGTSSNTVASFLFTMHDFENEDPTGGPERFDHIFDSFEKLRPCFAQLCSAFFNLTQK